MKTLIISILAIFATLPSPPPAKSVYDFTVKNINGQEESLKQYEGKVLLIVNVASKCGLTPQYKDIQELFEKYESQGFVVLGFPANNFLGQEPGSNEEIKQFCTNKYKVSFPMYEKISVKGKDIHPLYKFLTKKTENKKLDAPVKWNFQKFLINKKGNVVTSFAPSKAVTDKEVSQAIEAELKK